MTDEVTSDEGAYVSLWKTSHREMGERHLDGGYPASDFPGVAGARPDGNAYFAKDRWIAEVFARPAMLGYEDFIIETRILADDYRRLLQPYEHSVTIGGGTGIEVAIPSERLDELNRVSVRLKVDPEDDVTNVKRNVDSTEDC